MDDLDLLDDFDDDASEVDVDEADLSEEEDNETEDETAGLHLGEQIKLAWEKIVLSATLSAHRTTSPITIMLGLPKPDAAKSRGKCTKVVINCACLAQLAD